VPEGALFARQGLSLADVVIPSLASSNRTDVDDFATSIQHVIADLAAQKPCGWIVDLRRAEEVLSEATISTNDPVIHAASAWLFSISAGESAIPCSRR
jgi:hypothetical protein